MASVRIGNRAAKTRTKSLTSPNGGRSDWGPGKASASASVCRSMMLSMSGTGHALGRSSVRL